MVSDNQLGIMSYNKLFLDSIKSKSEVFYGGIHRGYNEAVGPWAQSQPNTTGRG